MTIPLTLSNGNPAEMSMISIRQGELQAMIRKLKTMAIAKAKGRIWSMDRLGTMKDYYKRKGVRAQVKS